MAETESVPRIKEKENSFLQSWNQYQAFEKYFRQKGEKLSDFLRQWKVKMNIAQSAGCQYSNILLAFKLLEKSNLENEDMQYILGSFTNTQSEVLSIMIARLEAFSPEHSEREESQCNNKKDSLYSSEIKEEISERLLHPTSFSSGWLNSSHQEGSTVTSKCPNCGSVEGLVAVKPDESKNGSLFCKSCLVAVRSTTVIGHDSPDDNQEEHLDDISLEIKDEPEETPQSLLEIDITDIDRKKPKAKVKGDKKIIKRMEMRKSQLSSKDTASAIHPCSECGRKFDRIVRVINHMAIKHKMESSKLVEYENQLRARPKTKRSKKDNLAAEIASDDEAETNVIKSDLAEGSDETEDGKEKFQSSQCEFCGNYFFKRGMQNHYKHCRSVNHPQRPSQNGKDTNVLPGESSKFQRSQCEFCGNYFFQKGLQTHYKRCRSNPQPNSLPKAEKAKEKKASMKNKAFERLQCEFCGKEYPHFSRLKEHYAVCPNLDQEQKESYIRPCNRRLPCNICGKILSGALNLRLHMTTHGEKNYKCEICEATFPNAQYLGFHKKRHGRSKSHKCFHCDKSFVEKFCLRRHIMKEHTNERPFQCDQCNYSTVNNDHLIRHNRRHTGERPFKCGVCDKLFRDKRSVKRHIRTQHKQDDFSGIIIRIFATTSAEQTL